MVQNILIVDDEKSNIDILLGLFDKINGKNNYNVIAALSGKKALEVVQKREIHLILLDIVMPEMDGYEVCKILKSDIKTKDIPILFITAKTDDESISKAYNIGAADYVTKPFRPVELLARVSINLKLQKTIAKLEYMAYYDPMTNIYNRRRFFEVATEKFIKENENLYAVMVDIDKFKAINDTHGHAVGDKVIKVIAKTLKEHLVNEAVFGRIGGEEFCIIYNCDSDSEIVKRVNTIIKNIEALDIEIGDNTFIKSTISSGIAKFDPTMSTIDHLLHKADEALYEAKDTGRNKSIFRL
ncbi:GGDEF domain-containing response regulator [Sulfurimonas sp.]|uniref:GGDEF domain-containing response regulator n=1 Tax=Sulfurimonas sp. TaxID=2022749 RepID=UPI003D0C77B7